MRVNLYASIYGSIYVAHKLDDIWKFGEVLGEPVGIIGTDEGSDVNGPNDANMDNYEIFPNQP